MYREQCGEYKCDLSRENVPYGIRSNSRTHGMWTNDKPLEKPFKTNGFERLKSNSWMAKGKFWTVEVKQLNG